jgi:hypothetical protein
MGAMKFMALLLACCGLFGSPAGLASEGGAGKGLANDSLARIASQIEQYPVVRSEFVQTKQMAALKRPLMTTGRLVFSRQYGVLWQIEKPFRMSYIIGDERIVEISSDGVRRERGLREVPGLAQVGRVFRALLGANTAALQEYFDIAVQGDVEQWQIELKPRQEQLAQFLTGMRLSGSRYVEEIRISEAGGDSTQIRLLKTQGDSVPSAAELLLFSGDGAASRR